MPSQHKHTPIPFRPPEGDRARLLALAERTGQPVNRILAAALTAYLDAPAIDRAELRCLVDDALQDSVVRCARCQACDYQVDAVMAVLDDTAFGTKRPTGD